jgi:hypothetical protein
MRTMSIKLFALGAVASLAIAGSAQARHGADDPAGHQRHAHHAHHHHHKGAHHARHGHGADDPAGHR